MSISKGFGGDKLDKGKGVGWEEDKQIGHHQPVVVGPPPMPILNASKPFSTTSYLKLNMPHDHELWVQLKFKGGFGLQILHESMGNWYGLGKKKNYLATTLI